MRLAPSELENITPYQFNLLREGYNKDQKFRWERSRFIAYWVYTMAGKVSSEDKTIEEFRPLDEDDLKLKPSEKLDPKFTKKQKEFLDNIFNPSE